MKYIKKFNENSSNQKEIISELSSYLKSIGDTEFNLVPYESPEDCLADTFEKMIKNIDSETKGKKDIPNLFLATIVDYYLSGEIDGEGLVKCYVPMIKGNMTFVANEEFEIVGIDSKFFVGKAKNNRHEIDNLLDQTGYEIVSFEQIYGSEG